MRVQQKIPTLSLFSGAGGLDIGFDQAGFDIVGCVEIEKQYCDTLVANRDAGRYFDPHAKIYCQDIRHFDAAEFSIMGIECVIGGPPCQPFSAAGRRAGGVPGIQDERGMLFESYCNVLKKLRPKVFVFENVYGLKGANGGEPWKEMVSAFSNLNYNITAEIVDAADYGVPQHRERLILVGVLDGEFVFPEPTHGPDSSSGKPLVSVWDAIKDIQDECVKSEEIGGLYGHLLPLVPEGLNYSFFTKEMGYPEPYFAWRSKFHDFLYKADRYKPSRTLKANPGKFTGPFHWNNRRFTTHELRRIQSFPDDYIITGTDKQVIAQIGNSVPPTLAEVLAVSIREQILRPVDTLTYPKRKAGFVSTFRHRQRSTNEYYQQVAKKEIEKRFPLPERAENPESKYKQHTYYMGVKAPFSKEIFSREPSEQIKASFTSVFKVHSVQHARKIQVRVNEITLKEENVVGTIEVTGLEKYLISTDVVCAKFTLQAVESIFYVWDAVQKELVDASQFYTLIDIYGHYANRGDTVEVSTKIENGLDTLPIRAINYFGSSKNCGIFLNRNRVAEDLGISVAGIDSMICAMRDLRFDVRAMQTHQTIRTNELLCTYPFPMLSERAMFKPFVFDKQGAGKLDENELMRGILEDCYAKAEEENAKEDLNDLIGSVGKEAAATFIELAGINHAARGAALTLAVYKVINPQQDIRNHKSEYENGFSARGVDTKVTVPFLIKHGLPYNVETHWLSQTLSFAGPFMPDLVLKTVPKKAGPSLVAAANLIEAATDEQLKKYIILILEKMIEERNKGNIPLTRPKNLSIDQVMELLHRHFSATYKKNAPRLPQVAIYAIYQCLMTDVERYSSFELMPLERMKTANRKSGSVGDIDLCRDGRPIEAVEIKFEIPINTAHVTEAIQKIQAESVERYFILSTAGIEAGDISEIQELKENFLKTNGCEIIVNGVYDTIKYYLRLLNSTNEFINSYTDLLATDNDVNYEHKVAWNRVCAER